MFFEVSKKSQLLLEKIRKLNYKIKTGRNGKKEKKGKKRIEEIPEEISQANHHLCKTARAGI